MFVFERMEWKTRRGNCGIFCFTNLWIFLPYIFCGSLSLSVTVCINSDTKIILLRIYTTDIYYYHFRLLHHSIFPIFHFPFSIFIEYFWINHFTNVVVFFFIFPYDTISNKWWFISWCIVYKTIANRKERKRKIENLFEG